MLQKLLCWLFGHKSVYRAYIGQTATITDSLTLQDRTLPVTKWVRSNFCLRCGTKVHDDDVQVKGEGGEK